MRKTTFKPEKAGGAYGLTPQLKFVSKIDNPAGQAIDRCYRRGIRNQPRLLSLSSSCRQITRTQGPGKNISEGVQATLHPRDDQINPGEESNATPRGELPPTRPVQALAVLAIVADPCDLDGEAKGIRPCTPSKFGAQSWDQASITARKVTACYVAPSFLSEIWGIATVELSKAICAPSKFAVGNEKKSFILVGQRPAASIVKTVSVLSLGILPKSPTAKNLGISRCPNRGVTESGMRWDSLRSGPHVTDAKMSVLCGYPKFHPICPQGENSTPTPWFKNLGRPSANVLGLIDAKNAGLLAVYQDRGFPASMGPSLLKSALPKVDVRVPRLPPMTAGEISLTRRIRVQMAVRELIETMKRSE